MDDRRAQFQVGLLVVAALALAGMLVVLFGESPALGTNQYTVYIRFPQAPGGMTGPEHHGISRVANHRCAAATDEGSDGPPLQGFDLVIHVLGRQWRRPGNKTNHQ